MRREELEELKEDNRSETRPAERDLEAIYQDLLESPRGAVLTVFKD